MSEKKETHTAEDVLKTFRRLLDKTTLPCEDIYDTLEEEFGKKPLIIKSFWEKLWE